MHPLWIRLRERGRSIILVAQGHAGLSPIQAICRDIERQGFPLATACALEVFGGDGSLHTRYYASRVRSLEVWEHDPRQADALHRNLPNAKIKIVDSYAEIDRTAERFDFVWVDNPEMMHGPYCEHFDLLPRVFRILADQAVIVFVVIPRLDAPMERRYPYLWDPRFNDITVHLARRARFYGTNTPEHVPLPRMLSVYMRLAQEQGYEILWTMTRHISFFGYLALGMRRCETT